MFPSRTTHVLLSSRILPFPLFLEFFPRVLIITPEGIYTFKFSLFSSCHLFSILFTVQIFRKKSPNCDHSCLNLYNFPGFSCFLSKSQCSDFVLGQNLVLEKPYEASGSGEEMLQSECSAPSVMS